MASARAASSAGEAALQLDENGFELHTSLVAKYTALRHSQQPRAADWPSLLEQARAKQYRSGGAAALRRRRVRLVARKVQPELREVTAWPLLLRAGEIRPRR